MLVILILGFLAVHFVNDAALRDLRSRGQTDFGQTDFGQNWGGRLWPNRLRPILVFQYFRVFQKKTKNMEELSPKGGAREGGAPKGGGPEKWGARREKLGPRRVGPRRVGGERCRAQNFALFFSSPATSSMLSGVAWNFGGV